MIFIINVDIFKERLEKLVLNTVEVFEINKEPFPLFILRIHHETKRRLLDISKRILAQKWK